MAIEVGILFIDVKLEKYSILFYFNDSINFILRWPRPALGTDRLRVGSPGLIKSTLLTTPPAGQNLRRHGGVFWGCLFVCRRVPEHNLQEGLKLIPI